MSEIQEAYKVMQEASRIGAGDNVRVIRKFATDEMGCNCFKWDYDHKKAEMQDQAYKVHTVSSGYIEIDYYSFPFFALELIEKAKVEKMIMVDGKEWSESTVKLALQEHAK